MRRGSIPVLANRRGVDNNAKQEAIGLEATETSTYQRARELLEVVADQIDIRRRAALVIGRAAPAPPGATLQTPVVK